jgi:hypothetical protein
VNSIKSRDEVFMTRCFGIAVIALTLEGSVATAAQIVALGASNTEGRVAAATQMVYRASWLIPPNSNVCSIQTAAACRW